MEPFVYDIPTKVYFGKEELCHLGEELAKYGKKVFFIYSGDYIKDIGIYDLVSNECKKHGLEFVVYNRVMPNPRHTDVQDGIDLCRLEGCDVILAVGGGSAIDSAKAIASGFYIDAPIWDVILGKYEVTRSLPIVTISTLSATGSEMNMGAVISNLNTHDKQSLRRPTQKPKATFLNPEYTYTVGSFQTACGVVDMICHTIETYFSDDEPMYMLDTVMEGLVRTAFKYGPIAFKDPKNYEARANLMWVAPWAINDFIRYDKSKLWTMHPIEHELSAYYDITHGLGLAIIMPRYLRHIIDEKSLPRFKQLGIYALDIDRDLSLEETAEAVIKKIEDLCYREFGLASSLSELGIDGKDFDEIATKLAKDDGYFTTGYRRLSKDEIVKILNECL